MSRIEQALLRALEDEATDTFAAEPRAQRPDPRLRLVSPPQPKTLQPARNPYTRREIASTSKPRLSAPVVEFARPGLGSAVEAWDAALEQASVLARRPIVEPAFDHVLEQASALSRAPRVTAHVFAPTPGPSQSVDSEVSRPVPATAPAAMETPDAARATLEQGFRWTPVQAYTQAGGAVLAHPLAAEQFRKLAGQVIRAQELHGVKVITITSALQGEGKSVTSSALALTLANSYKRDVLLVDADMRLPALQALFQLPGGYGLSDVIDQGRADQVSPYQVSPMLAVLTAGRPTQDPVGALTSSRMRAFIEAASAKYDFVVIDTPPVAVLPDANLLGSIVDAALLVIRAGETQYEFVSRAIEAIKKERILGVVLNQAEKGLALKAYEYSKY